ncbi:MAG: OmpA family protein [Chitinophagaceae bacterium]|nr:OmpA family protein [Chitinophagaceae bacterium]
MMKKLFLSVIAIFFLKSSFSQYDPSKISKNAVKLYDQAMERVQEENFISATGLLQKAIETDKNYVDAYLVLADVYGVLRNYKSSIQYFEKAFALDSVYTISDKLSYSKQLAATGEFEKALSAINELLAKKPPKNSTSLGLIVKRKKTYEFAVEQAKNYPDKKYVFAPQNLGHNINSSLLEYLPSSSIIDSGLIFTRRVSSGNEDFFYSKKEKEGWGVAQKMEGNINTPQSEAAQTMSADGEWIIYSANGRTDSYGNYDLYMAQRTPEGWTDTYHFNGRINSDQWESQPSLSADRKDLYFASRRPGGYGGIDIYVCHLQPNGYYSDPENLGPGVNTPGDDQCPFIHADNQTLYFTSNYWPGYGENDLFFVRKQSKGQWSKPVNLGYPINTVNDEGTLFIAADGKTAYYASDRTDSNGGLDIYTFELPEHIRPLKTLWVKGTVRDKKTNKELASTVQLIDLTTKEIMSDIQTGPDGSYFITLPVGKDYVFNVSQKGYLFYSDNFLMAGRSPDSTYEKNISLHPIETNASIVLKNIFFAINKFELKPGSQVELDKLVQLLNENPSLKIEISGHTDNVGKPADNLLLSNNRAKAVVTYLISKNIAASRLSSKGYGETKPVGDNKTEEGRAANRRTEMKVTGQ